MSDPNIRLVRSDMAPMPGKYIGRDPKVFIGKHVKLGFAAVHPITGQDTLEHMWVKVARVDDKLWLHGTLDNYPRLPNKGNFRYGNKVAFEVKEIEDVNPPLKVEKSS
jgi:hypothetical protein